MNNFRGFRLQVLAMMVCASALASTALADGVPENELRDRLKGGALTYILTGDRTTFAVPAQILKIEAPHFAYSPGGSPGWQPFGRTILMGGQNEVTVSFTDERFARAKVFARQVEVETALTEIQLNVFVGGNRYHTPWTQLTAQLAQVPWKDLAAALRNAPHSPRFRMTWGGSNPNPDGIPDPDTGAFVDYVIIYDRRTKNLYKSVTSGGRTRTAFRQSTERNITDADIEGRASQLAPGAPG